MVQGGISSEQGRSCGFERLEEEVRRKAVLSASQAGSTFPTAVLQSREELSFLHFQGKDSGSKCPWMIHNQDFLKKKSSLFGPEDGP